MAKKRWFLTDTFLEKMRTTVEIAVASPKLSLDLSQYAGLPKMSTWSLICEETVDTSHDNDYWMRVAAELKRRGITGGELEKMRMFAWRTAGWLNFERHVMEWISLDEEDIRRALVAQFQEGEITDREFCESLEFLSRYE
jgi:hypothetical protein